MRSITCPSSKIETYPHWSGPPSQMFIRASYFGDNLIVRHYCPVCNTQFGPRTIQEAGSMAVITATKLLKLAQKEVRTYSRKPPKWWTRTRKKPVALGSSLKDVHKTLGEPIATVQADDLGGQYLRYVVLGLDIEMDLDNEKVKCIHSTPPKGMPTSRKKVEKQIGSPTSEGEHTVRGERTAWAFYEVPGYGCATIEYLDDEPIRISMSNDATEANHRDPLFAEVTHIPAHGYGARQC